MVVQSKYAKSITRKALGALHCTQFIIQQLYKFPCILGLGLGLVYLAQFIKDKTIRVTKQNTVQGKERSLLAYLESFPIWKRSLIRLKVHMRTIQKNTSYQEEQLCNKEIRTQNCTKKENTKI